MYFYIEKDFDRKRLFIIIGIILAIVSILGSIIYFANKKTEPNISTTTIISSDNTFSIEVPNSMKYRINSATNNDFTIDLFSEKDDMFMYATTIEKKREVDLFEIANDDKRAYFKDKENLRDDTGVLGTLVNGYKAYEYSLVYYDKEYKKDFYCHVVWIESKSNIYVINFEVNNNNQEKFKNIFINIQNSFKELSEGV